MRQLRISSSLLLTLGLWALGCPSATPDPDPEPTPGSEQTLVIASPAEADDLDAADGVLRVALTAAPTDDGLAGPGFAYNGQIPGPTLRAQVGDTLIVDLQNDLDTPTTVHWHGVAVPWAMDGAVWMLDPVAPGAAAQITFELSEAGTFWYHPHFDTERQVDLGLYGVLVVEDPAEPDVPDVVLVFDDPAESAPYEGHGHSDFLPDGWMVNGVRGGVLPAPAGETLRGRLLNASNIAYLALRWPGMRVIAHDQGLLPALETPSTLVLAPGDRAEVEWPVGFEDIEVLSVPYSLHGGEVEGEPSVVLTIDPVGSSVPPSAVDWGFAGGDVPADPGWTDVRYVFQGGAEQWMINGELFPDVTVQSLPLGADAVLEVRNVSPTHHPFHLHGHSFAVLSDGDGPATSLRIEDTIDVRIREVVRLRLLADNPGDWMVHCHLLPHADQGMMTVLRVEE